MINIKKWIAGTITVELSGLGRDRLFNLCKKNNIMLNNLKQENEAYIFSISTKNYKKLLHYNQKIKSEIKVLNKSGLPHFLYKYRKRKIFILCFLLFLCSMFLFSCFVWNISINGNSCYTDIEIIKDIQDNYVQLGTKKTKINCSKLEKQLREKYDKLAWISCEIKGTNLIINVEETLSKEPVNKSKEPCNIIAYKDAIITDVIINNGQRLVSAGDEVKKNDILITGVVNIYNEYDELIESNLTRASGTIYGIVEYNYYDEFSTQSNQKKYTDSISSSYYIEIFNNVFKLPSKKLKYENYDIVTENNRLKLFDNFYLPISLSKSEYKEYSTQTVNITENEAISQAKSKLTLYIDNLKKKGVSILENNVTIEIVNGVCVAKGTIKCKEIIGIPSTIDITSAKESNVENNSTNTTNNINN